ncbi:MAG TPA: hypothetical protein VGD43_01780 [Micromonospora sp.]
MAITWASGMRMTPARLNAMPKGIIARGHRTSSSTATTSSVGVLRLDDVPVKSGRSYRVFTSGLTFVGTSGDTARARITHTTDGSTPTTASTQLGAGCRNRIAGTTGPEAPILIASETYHATADGLLSVLLVVTRSAGTGGSVSLFGSSTEPIELLIEDLGTDPGDTGTDV